MNQRSRLSELKGYHYIHPPAFLPARLLARFPVRRLAAEVVLAASLAGSVDNARSEKHMSGIGQRRAKDEKRKEDINAQMKKGRNKLN